MARKQPESDPEVSSSEPKQVEMTTKQSLFIEEATATMTSYRYAPQEDAYAACHDRHYLGKVDFYDFLRGVDINWRDANREQFYGIAKFTLEWLLIGMVDSLKELEITFQVSVKPENRKAAVKMIQEWKEAVARFHYRYGDRLVKVKNHRCGELQGVEHED